MAERHHAGRPHDEMQRDREQGEADDVGQQDRRIAIGDPGHDEEQRQPDQRKAPGRHGKGRRGLGGDALGRLRPPQQAIGPHDQHQRHDQEFDDQSQLGEGDLDAEPGDRADADAEGLGDADDHRRQEGAADAAEPAHDGDDEGVGDDGEIELEVGGLARDLQGPAQPRQHRAHEEDRGEKLGLVDAQSAHHLAILCGGPHQRAPARSRQQQPDCGQHHRTDRDQEQIIGRHALAHDLDGVGQARCPRAHEIFGAPGEQRDVLDHQDDGEGRQKLEKLGRAVDPPQHQQLDQDTDQPHRQGREHDRAPEAQGCAAQQLDQRIGAVEAQHVERTVREVHDPRDAEDQRQAGRHQEQRRGGGQPVQELDEDGGEGHEAILLPFRATTTVSSRGQRPRDLCCSAKIPRVARDDTFGVSGRRWLRHRQFFGLIFWTSASLGRASLPSTKRHSFMMPLPSFTPSRPT